MRQVLLSTTRDPMQIQMLYICYPDVCHGVHFHSLLYQRVWTVKEPLPSYDSSIVN